MQLDKYIYVYIIIIIYREYKVTQHYKLDACSTVDEITKI